MDQIDPITTLLLEGVRTQVFPGAVLFVRQQGTIRIHQGIGLTSRLPDSPPVHLKTIYDLASLTTLPRLPRLHRHGTRDVHGSKSAYRSCGSGTDH